MTAPLPRFPDEHAQFLRDLADELDEDEELQSDPFDAYDTATIREIADRLDGLR